MSVRSHRSPLAWLLAAALVLPASWADAESVLQQHRRAVRTNDVERFALSGVVTARPNDLILQTNILSEQLTQAGLGSLDLVQLSAGGQTLPVRIVRASAAAQFLQDTRDEDDDAVAALIYDENRPTAQTWLVAYSGSIGQALNAYSGMRVQVQVTRFRK